MFPEGHDRRASSARPAQRITSGDAELPEFSRAQVGPFVLFEVAPDRFDWVQFRCPAGQPFQSETVALGRDKVAYQSAAASQSLGGPRVAGIWTSFQQFVGSFGSIFAPLITFASNARLKQLWTHSRKRGGISEGLF